MPKHIDNVVEVRTGLFCEAMSVSDILADGPSGTQWYEGLVVQYAAWYTEGLGRLEGDPKLHKSFAVMGIPYRMQEMLDKFDWVVKYPNGFVKGFRSEEFFRKFVVRFERVRGQ